MYREGKIPMFDMEKAIKSNGRAAALNDTECTIYYLTKFNVVCIQQRII
jgi:hypothetical protein